MSGAFVNIVVLVNIQEWQIVVVSENDVVGGLRAVQRRSRVQSEKKKMFLV